MESPSAVEPSPKHGAPKRYGSVIKVRPEKLDEYKRLHAAVWPEILERIHKSNIRNYSIFLFGDTLFSYFEYVGQDFDADMAAIGEDPKTRAWWKVCEPCQQPLEWEGPPPSEGGKGNWWHPIDEVFHTD
eukprot:TRINITY_DN9439_c0_g1_i1.p2 TRINITY_DN9439_c0_g1~~TRINITY_DN9439_c0_g1_i1.p2  ORF type:complete len:137 (-),score=20.62 TRINITY_DN9439_c0_g1_i1:190-579(-)